MTTAEPGKEFKAIREASAVLESKAAVDRKFPDLHKTFTEHPKYNETTSIDYQNVIVKNSIAPNTSILSEIQQFDPKSPCGFIPLINRAYFVVKNRLCLLDYTKRDIEHLEEDDDIVGVGVIAPKPGIFVNNIKQLLVIATTSMIKILGIDHRPDGFTFVNSTMATLTNGVHMHQIVGTSQGRIFMLGNDDNVWELDYKAKETWFSSKCSKKLQTSGSSLNFLFGKSRDPIVQLAVNASGTILYQLTQSSSIQVVYLGTDGFTYDTVHKKHDCIADAKISHPSSQHFTPQTRIVSIHTTTKSESLSYHLVAITSNGSRIYYNNQKHAQQMNYDAAPTGLVTVHVRTPANSVAPTDTVSHCLYRNGLTLFVKNADASSSSSTTQSQMVAYSPSLANLGNQVLANATAQLIEDGTTLDVHGKVLCVMEAPTGCDDINEFKYAYHTPARHFLVLTTSGVTVLAKQRPVDMLHNLLKKTVPDTRFRFKEFEPFFNQFGYLNGCSLCFNLICAANVLPTTDDVFANSTIHTCVADAALELLKKFGQVTSALSDYNRRSYSSLHDGLALFIHRSLQGIWGKSLVKETRTSTGVFYTHNVPTDQLKSVQNTMFSIKRIIDQHPDLLHMTPDTPETTSYMQLLTLIDYLRDAMSFFLYLISRDLDAIVKAITKPASRMRLLQNDIKTLLTTQEAMPTVTSDLPAALIEYTANRHGDNISYVIDTLTHQCGSFCRASDVYMHKAAKQMASAKTAANAEQARAILHETVSLLSIISDRISHVEAVEFANQFVELGYYEFGVQLALDCAQVRDPTNAVTAYLDAGFPPHDPRQAIFSKKQPFYDIAVAILRRVLMDPSQTEDYRSRLMLIAFNPARNDKAFQFYTYDTFLKENIGTVLVKVNAPNLEQYLKSPTEVKRLRLLAFYYETHQNYDKAARVYYNVSQLPISLNEKLESLSNAEMCARSVTTSAKLVDMDRLSYEINANKQNIQIQLETSTVQ